MGSLSNIRNMAEELWKTKVRIQRGAHKDLRSNVLKPHCASKQASLEPGLNMVPCISFAGMTKTHYNWILKTWSTEKFQTQSHVILFTEGCFELTHKGQFKTQNNVQYNEKH